ncbi:MAG: hypothetical protein NTZ09_02180 [Candidatus Hydrogenedentes bacterium]|nr:hypothetical protein [Candidatus Hydrogenedentota bacterium]
MNGEFVVMIFIGLSLIMTLSLVKTVMKFNAGSSGRRQDIEDTRLVQDIHRQFEQIEQRVEALETILLERESASARTAQKD